MGRSIIPLRPKDFSSPLSQQEQACLTWFVLSGCTKKEAFVTFARPDMLGSKAKAAVDDFVKQFFARKESKDYISAYEDTLSEILNGKRRESRPDDGASVEEKKSRALSKLVEYVLAESENIDYADDPKAILEYANKIGIFDVGEKVEERPRRYLPVSCGECAYRKFVEENCERSEGTEFEAK